MGRKGNGCFWVRCWEYRSSGTGVKERHGIADREFSIEQLFDCTWAWSVHAYDVHAIIGSPA